MIVYDASITLASLQAHNHQRSHPERAGKPPQPPAPARPSVLDEARDAAVARKQAVEATKTADYQPGQLFSAKA